MPQRLWAALSRGSAYLVLGVLLAAIVSGQANNNRSASIYVQASAPQTGIDIGYFWYDTSAAALKIATATSPVVWTALGSGGGGGGLPSGVILPIAAGTCPAGTTEVSALNGRGLVGTLAANGNVGTSGGNDSITPTGTVSAPIFAGSALGTHQHELPLHIVSATSMRALPAATFGTGTSRVAGGGWTTTAATTSAAVAKDQPVSAGTPAGTVSAPTFTGTVFDNRSAFTRVIFCQAT